MGLARQSVDTLFYASGASSIQTHVPIQRFQRDVQALANHVIMHTQTALELYGRVLCGCRRIHRSTDREAPPRSSKIIECELAGA